MEKTSQILVATIAATTAMTLFSYILSWSLKKCFKEPALLELIFGSLFKITNDSVRLVVAWVFHYSVGLLFVLSYEFIWANTLLEPNWKSGLLFGFICGIIAIVAWSILLKIPDEMPKLNKKQYYTQLMIAHFIFSFTAVGIYNLL